MQANEATERVTAFLQHMLAAEDAGGAALSQVVVAVDAADTALVAAVRGACDTHPFASCLEIAPWGGFVSALNALVIHAARGGASTIIAASLEARPSAHAAQALVDQLDGSTLCCGAVLEGHDWQGHGSSVELRGDTVPWNTLCAWDVSKLGLFGFPLIADGALPGLRSDGGVEEVTAIAVAQRCAGGSALAKLLRVDGAQWHTGDFDSARAARHAAKMASKRSRAEKQLAALRFPGQSPGMVLHLDASPPAPVMSLPSHTPETVLVTGGAGFIGGHVCERLMQRGDRVIVVDCVNSYYDPRQKRATLEILRNVARPGQLEIEEVDIRDKAGLSSVFARQQPTRICHLAAQAGVRYSIENVHENIATNITGTVNILQLAAEYKVTNCVCASSSSVYGKDTPAPFSEAATADKPISPYAATKRADELFGHTFSHLYDVPVTMLRFFTVYGPRGRPDMACLKFIDMVSKGQPITRYGDGSALREFTYVDDIVDGVVSAIDRPRPFLAVNLGGGAVQSLQYLIDCIEKHVGRPVVIKQLPDQQGDVPLTSADQTVAAAALGFSPKISLDEGVRRTVEWYREHAVWMHAKPATVQPKRFADVIVADRCDNRMGLVLKQDSESSSTQSPGASDVDSDKESSESPTSLSIPCLV